MRGWKCFVSRGSHREIWEDRMMLESHEEKHVKQHLTHGEESVAKTIESEVDEDDDERGWKGMKSILSIEGKNWRQELKTGLKECLSFSRHQDKENPSEGPSMSLLPFIPASLDDFLVSLLSLNLPLRWVLTFENIYLFAVRYNLMIYKYYTSKFALLYAHS